jgi:hypothetical protein
MPSKAQKLITDLSIIEKDTEFQQTANKADAAINYAEKLEIKTEKDFETTITANAAIADRIKSGEAQRRFFVQPLNDHVGRINMLFKPVIDKYKKAKEIIDGKVVEYHDRKEAEERKQKEKILAEEKAGKISLEQAVVKSEKVAEAKKTSEGEDGARITFTIRPELHITDESKLPRQYLLPDRIKINTALKAGIKVPGAELIKVKIPMTKRQYGQKDYGSIDSFN